MKHQRECPECGDWMEYHSPEIDTGLYGGWDCPCGHTEIDCWEDVFDDDRGV